MSNSKINKHHSKKFWAANAFVCCNLDVFHCYLNKLCKIIYTHAVSLNGWLNLFIHFLEHPNCESNFYSQFMTYFKWIVCQIFVNKINNVYFWYGRHFSFSDCFNNLNGMEILLHFIKYLIRFTVEGNRDLDI